MSETASTIIKLLSALTSPRAAIKYIAVGVSIFVSYDFVSTYLTLNEFPPENINLVSILIGVGVGSLGGEFISWLGTKIWIKILECLNKGKLAEEKKKSEEAAKKAIEDKNRRIVDNFKQSMDLLDRDQIVLLRNLTTGNRVANFDGSFGQGGQFKALHENKYIEVVAKYASRKYIVRLNPILIDCVKDHWASEIDSRVDEYLQDITLGKEQILDLLDSGIKEEIPDLTEEIKSVATTHSSCIKRESYQDGFHLYFDDYYAEAFSEKTGRKFEEWVWVANDRLSEIEEE